MNPIIRRARMEMERKKRNLIEHSSRILNFASFDHFKSFQSSWIKQMFTKLFYAAH